MLQCKAWLSGFCNRLRLPDASKLDNGKPTEQNEVMSVQSTVDKSASLPVANLKFSRRTWIAASLTLAATAAAVFFAISLWPTQPTELTATQAASQAISFHSKHLSERADNDSVKRFRFLMKTNSDYESLQPPKRIILNVQTRWRATTGLLSSKGIAWDLSSAGGVTATLYVLPKKVTNWPTTPAEIPQANTGGLTAWAWSNGEQVYLLVIDGDQHDFDQFVRPIPPLI